MLKYMLLLIIPGVLFSKNVNFEIPSQVSKKADPQHVKQSKDTKASEKHLLTKTTRASLINERKKIGNISFSKGKSANLKKEVMKNPEARGLRERRVEERRRKAARAKKK